MLIPLPALAESDTTHLMPEVRVEAGRLYSEKALEFAPVSVIDAGEISESGEENLAEIIKYSPGVSIKDYGGMGGLKTVSVRGTSANQTAVLWNGMRLNSTSTGLFDLGGFPLSLISNIEIVRGGQSVLYGSNAMGGAVNLNTGGSELKHEIFASGSSILDFRLHTNQALDKEHNSGLYLGTDYSHGAYSFPVNNFGEASEYERENNTHLRSYLLATFDEVIAGYDLNVLLNVSKTSVPGPVVTGNPENSTANLLNGKLLINALNLYELGENESIESNFLLNLSYIKFEDERAIAFGPAGLNNKFMNYDILTKHRYIADFGFINPSLSAEINYSSLNGDMLDASVNSIVERFNPAISVNSDTDELGIVIGGISFLLGLRGDYFSDAGSALSGVGGFSLKLNYLPAVFRANVSHNFRPPGFHELYYLNYGNSELKPEKSLSFNAGTDWYFENISIGADAFLLETLDQIIAVPRSPVSWSARNIGKTQSKGIELYLKAHIWSCLDVLANYTLQETKDISESSLTYDKLVPYIPQEIIFAKIASQVGGLRLGAGMEYSSFRYSLPDNTIASVIPEYLLFDFEASYKINRIFYGESNIEIKLQALNVFNERYEVIRNYPMPGRYFRLSIYYRLEKSAFDVIDTSSPDPI